MIIRCEFAVAAKLEFAHLGSRGLVHPMTRCFFLSAGVNRGPRLPVSQTGRQPAMAGGRTCWLMVSCRSKSTSRQVDKGQAHPAGQPAAIHPCAHIQLAGRPVTHPGAYPGPCSDSVHMLLLEKSWLKPIGYTWPCLARRARALGPCLAASNRILVSVMKQCEHQYQAGDS
jgi:hypothetical protein